MSKPLKGFITYSHEDEQKRKKLRRCLAVIERAGEIKLWDDTGITAGGEARQEAILKVVAGSDILLYLVSADSLASENCNKELTEAVDAEIKVIPIILERCDWLNDRLSNFQALPDKGEPINKWEPESDGWQNVVDGIRNVVKEILSQAELAFQHGNTFMMIKQMAMAIERYSHAIDLNPDFAEAYNNRGIAYDNKSEYYRAISDFDMAIQLNPNDAIVYNNRGFSYNNKSDYDRAIWDFNMAIQLNPNYASAYNNRGFAYNNKGEYDRAIWDFNMAIQLNPNDTSAYYNRGYAYHMKGMHNQAIEDFNIALHLNPNYANAYYNRGIAWLHLRVWENARLDLTNARNMGVDIIAAFHNIYESVSNFESKYGIQLPLDIAAMLTPPQARMLTNRLTPTEIPL